MLGAMTDHDAVVIARWPGQSPSMVEGLRDLLAAYHLRTEAEKGQDVADVAALPERYRAEIMEPQLVFAHDVVLVASSGDSMVGCVVVAAPVEGRTELKRLWVDSALRGRGVASALVNAALEHAEESRTATVRLSVWKWRTNAIALYERLGFTVTDSWDARDQLVCMEHIGGAPTTTR